MNKIPGITPSDEYQTLRDEILQSKKYVFERPLLIITVALASINFIEKPYIACFPPIAIGLLTFNLWFTVNRMKSIARIVAYIQLELEERRWQPWLGWETCLRYYRKWSKQDQSKQDQSPVPDTIGYYYTIFIMHVCAVLILFIFSLLEILNKFSWYTFIFFVFTVIACIVFFCFAFNWSPKKCLGMLEEERFRWRCIFEELEAKGIKKKTK